MSTLSTHAPHNPKTPLRLAWSLLAATLTLGAGFALAPASLLAATNSAASTPALPIPASAKVQSAGAQTQTAGVTAAPPVAAGGTSAPAPTVSTATAPTTTYVPSGAATAPAVTPSTPATTPTTTAPGGSATAVITRTPVDGKGAKKGDRPLSTAAILLAVLAVLLILGCVLWALARRRAFEPDWLLSWRHAIAEAGFRASATWAEFTDWARLGR